MKFSKFRLATIAGIIAIVTWSSNIAVSKSVMNNFGAFKAAFYIYFFSGILFLLILTVSLGKKTFISHFRSLPLSYYLKTGVFFILNNTLLYAAIGLARNNEELIIVTILNYLWPVFIFILRVPFFKAKINLYLFYPAIITALAGIMIALIQGYSKDEIIKIFSSFDDNILAFVFAVGGAFSWAVYSNMIRKYNTADDIAGMPLIFLFSGIVFLGIIYFKGETASLDFLAALSSWSLIYTIAGPTVIGYLFWYLAMKYGNRSLVGSLSYFIPLGSVLLISLIHSIPIGRMFWISVILLVISAFLGMKAVHDNS